MSYNCPKSLRPTSIDSACPGVALAEQTLFIVIASILATFDIRPREGEVYAISRHTDGLIRWVRDPIMISPGVLTFSGQPQQSFLL